MLRISTISNNDGEFGRISWRCDTSEAILSDYVVIECCPEDERDPKQGSSTRRWLAVSPVAPLGASLSTERCGLVLSTNS
jgi:hypothetical protein